MRKTGDQSATEHETLGEDYPNFRDVWQRTVCRELCAWLARLSYGSAAEQKRLRDVFRTLEDKYGFVRSEESQRQQCASLAESNPDSVVGWAFELDHLRDRDEGKVIAAVQDRDGVFTGTLKSMAQAAAVLGISVSTLEKRLQREPKYGASLGRVKLNRTRVTFDAMKVLKAAHGEYHESVRAKHCRTNAEQTRC